MLPKRERLLQLARLIGADAFAARFGPPQSAEPEREALRSLVQERIEGIAERLVEEAAASDDVLDAGSALGYLEDRLRTLGDLLSDGQAERIRALFAERIERW